MELELTLNVLHIVTLMCWFGHACTCTAAVGYLEFYALLTSALLLMGNVHDNSCQWAIPFLMHCCWFVVKVAYSNSCCCLLSTSQGIEEIDKYTGCWLWWGKSRREGRREEGGKGAGKRREGGRERERERERERLAIYHHCRKRDNRKKSDQKMNSSIVMRRP